MLPTRLAVPIPVRVALACVAVAIVEWLAARADPWLVGRWESLVVDMGGAAPTVLGPLVGSLGTATLLIAAFIALLRLGWLDSPDGSEVAIGISGQDMPFLLAGLLFVALYASLSDAALTALGTPRGVHGEVGATLLGATLVVPIVQELLLRGGLMPTIERRLGASAAIVLAALPALVPLAPAPALMALEIAPQLFFGWVAWSCRSLGAAAVLHVTYAAIGRLLAG